MEKKSLYDMNICPKLEEHKRCKDCLFWGNLNRIELGRSKEFLMDGEDKMIIIENRGCAVLFEICPECIIKQPWESGSGLIGKMYEKWGGFHIRCEPAFLTQRQGEKKLYCRECKKTFEHSEVKHLIDVNKIVKAERNIS